MNQLASRTISPASENLRRNLAGLLKAREIPILRFCTEVGLNRRGFYEVLGGKSGTSIDRVYLMAEYFGLAAGDLIDGILPEVVAVEESEATEASP